jgi:thioesterase domain-containing protein/acyl carrier protein
MSRLWCSTLGVAAVGVNDDFFELGGDSLAAATLCMRMEAAFDLRLPLSTFLTHPTIARLAAVLGRAEAPASWDPLVAIRPGGTRPPFFFAHGHLGNVVGFHALARHLGEDQPFYAFQAQGLDKESSPISSMSEMARGYVRSLRCLQPSGPYHLGGFCFGGGLAVEMARQLRASGESVALVVSVDGVCPGYPRWKPGARPWARRWAVLWARLQGEVDYLREQSSKVRRNHLLMRAGRVGRAVVRLARRAVGRGRPSSPAAAVDGVSLGMSLEEAHRIAFRTQGCAPYDGDLLVIRASRQPRGIEADPTLGWGRVVRGKVHTAEVPGGRLGILTEPRVRWVARIIAEHLARCGSPP